MKSYEIPNTDNLTHDKAVGIFATVSADIAGDKDHPQINKHHPQHKLFQEPMRKVFEAKSEGNPVTKICNDALVKHKAKKQAVKDEAQTIKNKLREMGFAGEGLDVNNATQADVDCLQLQKLRGENNDAVFGDYMEQALFKCRNIPQEQLNSFWAWRKGNREETTEKNVSDLIRSVHKELKSREIPRYPKGE